MFKRMLMLEKDPKESFFLWGPRQSGKSTLLKKLYPKAHWVDLLHTETQIKYLNEPWRFREEVTLSERGESNGQKKLVIVDEIQMVPKLLDEIHWLIENKGMVFGMCGSSARKVRRGHANLLGGRALSYQLHGLISAELENSWQLNEVLNTGYLPRHYSAKNAQARMVSYINNYLKEEILAEGVVRNLPAFSDFLRMGAIGDTEMVNYSNIARESYVSVPTVKEYYRILEDTLLGSFVQPYRKRQKRRMIQAPKFYFEDVGVVNTLAKRGQLQQGGELYGKAMENWVYHELNTYNHYQQKFAEMTYWRTSSGLEVDFIVNDMELAVEVKSSKNIVSHHLKGIRELMAEQKVKRKIVVCTEETARKKEDGIEILPAKVFATELWEGNLF